MGLGGGGAGGGGGGGGGAVRPLENEEKASSSKHQRGSIGKPERPGGKPISRTQREKLIKEKKIHNLCFSRFTA